MILEIENFTVKYSPDPDAFEWEKIDIDWWRLLIAKYFYQFIPTIAVLYLAGIYFGQKWMKNRPSFELNWQLVFWNLGLAIFSTIVVYKSFWQGLSHLTNYGVKPSLCARLPYKESSGFWILAFTFSKLFELGDTVFLVLRKRKVIFLHWFHHFAVLNTLFYCFPKFESIMFLIGSINSGVHSIMYSYYALMAVGIKIPKKLSIVITAAQISQFITGMIFISFAVYQKNFGTNCNLSTNTIIFTAAQFLIYLVLFSRIFLNNWKLIKNKNTKFD